ncbi:unnamed protein product [Linum trigynum]|uniref:Retrotransposon gag domain-containing protein n=1 Tax=Linum trigynum TaxID=586398 RepID=A0AAV2G9G2_9ROSI
MRRFHELIDRIKINGVPADAIQLRYFPFTLKGKAKEWLDTRPPGSITTFANLADKFLTRYHPPSKTKDLQKQITHFANDDDETIWDAWERYTSLFLKCPNHGFTDAFKVGTFYHALFPKDKQLIDSVCGGNMLTKTLPQLNQLFEEMAEQGYDWGTTRRSIRAPGQGVHVVATQSSDLVQVVSKLVSTIDRSGMISGTGQQQAMHCQWCESSHHTVEDCQAMRESSTPQEQTTSPLGTTRLPEASLPAQTRAISAAATASLPAQTGASSTSVTSAAISSYRGSTCNPIQSDPVAELRDLVGSLATPSANKFNNIEQFMEKASGKFLELEAGQRNTQVVLRDNTDPTWECCPGCSSEDSWYSTQSDHPSSTGPK